MTDIYAPHPMHDGLVEWDDLIDPGDDFEPVHGWESVVESQYLDRHPHADCQYWEGE